jgi:menaquinone-dependent protoporphyrinogen oxidase
MATILVVFESKYGQSEKIAGFIADLASRAGHTSKAVRISATAALAIADSDAVVVVAPIYYDRHPAEVTAFLRAHVPALTTRPTAFVAVSGAAGSKDPEERAKAERAARTYVADVGLQPRLVTTAGGAMAYPRYPFFMRLMIRFISARKGGPTDMSRIHEATDWSALEATVTPFFATLEGATTREAAPASGPATARQ